MDKGIIIKIGDFEILNITHQSKIVDSHLKIERQDDNEDHLYIRHKDGEGAGISLKKFNELLTKLFYEIL